MGQNYTQDEFRPTDATEPTRASGEAAEKRWRLRDLDRAILAAADAWEMDGAPNGGLLYKALRDAIRARRDTQP